MSQVSVDLYNLILIRWHDLSLTHEHKLPRLLIVGCYKNNWKILMRKGLVIIFSYEIMPNVFILVRLHEFSFENTQVKIG